jgi:hypothetical protein
MSESPANTNAPADPINGVAQDWNEITRKNIQGFNKFIDKLEAENAPEPYVRLLKVLAPPLIRWRVDETRRETPANAREDAAAEVLANLMGNELFRQGEDFWSRVFRMTNFASSVTTKAAIRMADRERAEEAAAKAAAEAAKGQPQPATPDTGHA